MVEEDLPIQLNVRKVQEVNAKNIVESSGWNVWTLNLMSQPIKILKSP